MFRPMRRKHHLISDEAAKALLASERRGVLAVNGDDGYPFAIPVNYLYDEAANKIYLHGAKKGHKVDAINRCDKVCFTVYGNERIDENEKWAPYMQSAVVFGRCRLIDDPVDATPKIRAMAMKYYPSAEAVDEEIAKSLKGMYVYEISIEHLSGKEIQER